MLQLVHTAVSLAIINAHPEVVTLNNSAQGIFQDKYSHSFSFGLQNALSHMIPNTMCHTCGVTLLEHLA